jgi:DMSO/TMAO reductase YedYZ molybdopterin-dependent catalytic subunit
MLGDILKTAGLKDNARYIVFHCADLYHGKNYYESVDMFDAFHPQTILAWAMNDAPITVPHGAPIRLRAERLLGYKQAKYVMGVEAVASLAGFGKGQGGYWEDNVDYDSYAGI